MLSIKLIVTGQMEKLALHESLKRFFPSEKDGHEVVWDRPQLEDCATSHRLDPLRAPNKPMLALANAMFAAAVFGKDGNPSDLVIVIDDVELGNIGREDVVAAHFREAVSQHLTQYSVPTQTRYRSILQQKCSFHMLKPMVESYLFADSGALAKAGVPNTRIPMLVPNTDWEQFQSSDPVWLPTCISENVKQRVTKPWWKHECHPKRYLEHLVEHGVEFYEETTHGRRALEDLDWNSTLALPPNVPVIRSLFQDIADWFHVQNPLGQGAPPHPNFYPTRATNRALMLLRNM